MILTRIQAIEIYKFLSSTLVADRTVTGTLTLANVDNKSIQITWDSSNHYLKMIERSPEGYLILAETFWDSNQFVNAYQIKDNVKAASKIEAVLDRYDTSRAYTRYRRLYTIKNFPAYAEYESASNKMSKQTRGEEREKARRMLHEKWDPILNSPELQQVRKTFKDGWDSSKHDSQKLAAWLQDNT